LKVKKRVLFIILGICVLTAAVFAVALIRELYIDRQSRSFYSSLTAQVERRHDTPASQHPETHGIQSGQPDDIDGIQSEQTSSTQSEQPGDTNFWVPYVDFEALNDVFPGVVGWIKLEGTQIDYPVMQYTDNNYFLSHLPDGTEHRSGSIFLDYRNSSDFSDKSILIYGHETRDRDMFGALKNYRNQEFFDANPVIYLYTPERDYTIVLFAGHVAHSIHDHPPLDFNNDEDFLQYVERLKSISVFNSNIEVTTADRIISLVTCTYDFTDARLIIVGKIVVSS
jgi:sortase B